MTRKGFLRAYRRHVITMYEWAKDQRKLDKYLTACERTLQGTSQDWHHLGPAVDRAWSDIGGKGKRPTLGALRALA